MNSPVLCMKVNELLHVRYKLMWERFKTHQDY